MKRFKLYAVVRKRLIPITSFDNTQTNIPHDIGETFNEKLQESENSQYTLTFDIAKYYYERGERISNIYLPLLYLGSKLRLIIDDETVIDFIVKAVNPSTIGKENIIYSFTAQDEFSYLLSRHSLGYSYSTKQVTNIYDIIQQVLEDNCISYYVYDAASGNYFVRRDADGQKINREDTWVVLYSKAYTSTTRDAAQANTLTEQPITLEVENSNPYNVIIEGCNALNCYLQINYSTHTINVLQKDKVAFSGYRYNPQRNLASFSVDYNLDEYTSILHVSGGTNEYEENISMVPAIPEPILDWLEEPNNVKNWENYSIFPENWYTNVILAAIKGQEVWTTYPDDLKEKCEEFCRIADKVPHLGQFLFDFNVFHNNGYLTDLDIEKINDIINTQMRKNNIHLKHLVPLQYQLEWVLHKMDTQLQELASEYEAEQQSDEPDSAVLTNIKNKIANILIGSTLDGAAAENITNAYPYMTTLDALVGGEYGGAETDLLQTDNIKFYSEQAAYYTREYNDTIELLQAATAKKDDLAGRVPLDDLDYINAASQEAFYKQRAELYKTLKETWINKKGIEVKGLYKFIYDTLAENYTAWLNQEDPPQRTKLGVYNLVSKYQNANKALWQQLYLQYGQFIYEAQYENADELNSIALYNQAVAYFAASKIPKANYSLEVIDIAALEQIDVPRLAVGSHIQVMHSEVQYWTNDQYLLVTGLSYDLRSPGKISVTINTIENYNSIVEKLLKQLT